MRAVEQTPSHTEKGFFLRGCTIVATRRLSLTYPPHLIKEPVIYTVAKEYNLIPNIRKARVTDTIGEVILDFEGQEEDLAKGIAYLAQQGITVEEVRQGR
jgi:ABC-type methionine transport system ATPase subunit